jgi:hypothetical protein
MHGKLDCLKYLVEEAKVPLNQGDFIAFARYYERHECLNYLLEKGCPEPTDEEYVAFILRRGGENENERERERMRERDKNFPARALAYF